MRHTSSFLIGCDARAEQRVAELIGSKPARFFALAQRIASGTSQPDLVQVDVRGTLARLIALHPDLFVTHLLVAFATRASEPERAAEALARAHASCSDDHPWRYLLPSDDDWAGQRPMQRVHEVAPDRVWRVRADHQVTGTPFFAPSTATIVRDEAGALTIINPVELTRQSSERVRALGEVTTLVVQGRANRRDVARARAQFPRARLLGTAAGAAHPANRSLRFDGLLGGASSALPSEFVALPVDGTQAGEVVLLHRPSELLIVQELIANNRRDNSGQSFAGRLIDFAFGVDDRLGVQSYQPLLWNDLRTYQRGLARILATSHARVTGAHWPIALGADDVLTEVTALLDQLCKLTRAQLAAMRVEYLWHQPAFLRDALRYELRHKQSATQAA